MNVSFKRKRILLRPLALMLAVSLPTSVVLSAELADVVKTRPDQTIDQQYGRDSVYGFSPDSKPLTPAQTGPRESVIGTERHDVVASDASGFPSATRPEQTDPMDNDQASDPRPIDARSEGMRMGSGYTGEEGQSLAASGMNAYGGESFQALYEQRAMQVLPGTVIAPVASASEDQASSEFVIIVPEMSAVQDQSAALEENGRITLD